ncbi:VOC family protein [Kangiella koreensis]|uniref:Glyoxalase/fosfomycin resistance/dioxygenase domain-containing protein n=1 Tax=Kangiella koreensis (strain DSM 16069 / JCM 12317 / KCTC 12182 / SW-125) TaxID=523791 RepID=C7RAK1_KANKD|nr:VOC family protein [Kangiella koreensis]ACV26293.1 conserved hypothetical protein [Kangiella koreensis DSM 16069]
MSNIYFEIQATEPIRAISFYEKALGWKFTKMDMLPIDYWRIEGSNLSGGLMQSPAPLPPLECGTNAFVCSFEVSDFDKVAEVIKAEGGQVALPKFAVPGICWQGYFVDTENNTFGIFQPDESAK